MDVEGEAVEEGMGAQLAVVRAVAAAVEPAVELQVDVLGELGAAQLALVRFFPRVESQMCFQVAGAAEALLTHLQKHDMKRFRASASNTKTIIIKTRGASMSRSSWKSFAIRCHDVINNVVSGFDHVIPVGWVIGIKQEGLC